MSEAEELKRTVPDSDLWRELDDSDFARLTNPTSRVSVRAAYYAVHHDEINTRNMRAAAEAAAAETAKRLTGAYLSAQRRPQENGCASSAASLEAVDWRTASREQLIAQRRAILAAAAKGLSNNEIADGLKISPSGVNKHLLSIYQKLGVSSRAEAVALALSRQILKN